MPPRRGRWCNRCGPGTPSQPPLTNKRNPNCQTRMLYPRPLTIPAEAQASLSDRVHVVAVPPVKRIVHGDLEYPWSREDTRVSPIWQDTPHRCIHTTQAERPVPNRGSLGVKCHVSAQRQKSFERLHKNKKKQERPFNHGPNS